MRLIDADELIKDRVENDPVRIAAECAPTAFDKEKVLEKLGAEKNGKLDYCIEFAGANTIAKAEFRAFDDAIRIVEKGGIE